MRKHLFIGALMATLVLPAGATWATPSFDVRFSPEGTAQQRVIRLLAEAQTSIRLMGYSFLQLYIARRGTRPDGCPPARRGRQGGGRRKGQPQQSQPGGDEPGR